MSFERATGSRNNCPASSKGWTVLELLIVLVLILIISGLLSLVTGRIARVRKNTECLLNMRMTGQQLLAHAADHNGRSVVAYYDVARSQRPGQSEVWHERLVRGGYLEKSQREKIVCSSYDPFSYDTAHSKAAMYTYGLRRFSGAATYDPAYQGSKVSNPSSYILLADSYSKAEKRQFYYLSWPGTGNAVKIHLRHDGKAHLFFADGSARALNKEEIVALNDGWSPGICHDDL
ncbi:MAG TPA: H-X9-DG-CTERM domain-containing protein [Chthoniobacteraceae bacterium]|nr:H-X9-DG-CTERM domain-containing protein [Chthoniobacteraceae bacterium]